MKKIVYIDLDNVIGSTLGLEGGVADLKAGLKDGYREV